MKNHPLTMMIVIAILLLGFSISTALADVGPLVHASKGMQAEQEGKFRQALTHYVSALSEDGVLTPEGEEDLRKRAIKLAQKIQPPPAIPEKVHRHMARGEAFIEAANDKEGFLRAVKEFQAATNAAPWSADAYYNLGVSQDKAGQYDEAIKSLNLYLLAAPDASDARTVRNLIYKIEARKEQAKEKARRIEIEKQEKATRPAERLNGHWVGQIYLARVNYSFGEETYRIEGNGEHFEIILVSSIDGSHKYNRQAGDILFRLTLNGTVINGVYLQRKKNTYGCNPPKDQPVKGELRNNGNTIVLNYPVEWAMPWQKTFNSPVTGCAEHTRDYYKLTITKQ